MNWYFCVFGILALLAQNSAFLFDPPIPTPTNLVATTSSNGDQLLQCAQDVIKCVEPFQTFFNASDPQSVAKIDSEAVVNFTCSADGEKMMLCIANITGCDALTRQALPSLEHTREVCRNNRSVLHATTKCQSKFLASDAWLNCMEAGATNNQSHPGGEQCGAIQGSFDCYYKYVNLVCPEHWAFFEQQIGSTDVGNCHITIGTSLTATTCDDKMNLTCLTGRPDDHDTDRFVDFYCSEEGHQSKDCLDRFDAMCSPNNIVKDTLWETLEIPKHADFLCHGNKAVLEGYRQFAACMQNFIIDDTTYQTCGPDTSDGNVTCSDLQQTYDCVAASVVKNCPSVLPFFNDIGAKIYDLRLTPHCHVHPFSASTLPTPMISTPFPLFTMPPLNISNIETFTTELCDNLTDACMSGVDPNNIRVTVDYFCRSGGRPFDDCIRQQCGNDTHGLPNIDQLGVMCQDKAGLVRFAVCFQPILNDPAFENCTWTEHIPVTLAEQCSSVQHRYDCISREFATACPSSAPALYTYMSLSDYGQRCHIRPFTHHVAPRSLLSAITQLLIGEDTEELKL